MNSGPSVILNAADWPVLPLRDVTTILRRGTAPLYVDASNVLAIGQRCITNTDFASGYARPHSPRSMTNVLVPQQGDVLINSTGTGTIGRSVVFQERTGQYIVDGHVTVARPQPRVLAPRWLNDILRSPWGQQYLESQCYAGSTNQVELSSVALAGFPLAKPDFKEQQRIAEILDALDDQIRATEQLIEKSELVSQGVLDDVLSLGVTGTTLRDPSKDPNQFSKTDFGLLPLDWMVTTLGTLVHDRGGLIQTGPFGSQLHAYDYVPSGVPVVMPQDIQNGQVSRASIAMISESTAAKLGRHRLQSGDVVFSRRGDLERCAVISDRERGWLCGTGCLLVRPPQSVLHPGWLAYIYRHQTGQKYVRATAVGSTMANLNGRILADLPLPVPSIAEQRAILRALNAEHQHLKKESQVLEKLRNAKIGLMWDLLTGRVRVHMEIST